MPSITRYYSSTAAKTTLAASIDASTATVSITLAAASGLPNQYPYTLIIDKDTANEEIVEVSNLIGSTYTVVRGVDGTSPKSHSIGATVEHGVSGRDFAESRSHEAATSAHGVTGDVVGTGGAQTLTGKTLTTATLGSDLAAGGFKITNLATPTSSSDAATKAYIDTQTTSAAASASSAAVSASSAATSASSALTSQGSAAVSASSAATSATAAATSAASAATSATAAATSAASALASQTAAATSAASALASQTAAATSASSAATSATAAATSATSAAASATAAATSATSAAASATTASNSAATATTSAGQAATSATSAAASATAAATSATSAAASATTASNSAATATTSASQAATSASSAATSATAAATSASSAATSATAAATSASSAATSASSAATSAAAAATSYDDFDDRYLGAKSTPPSLDNDGNALITGALYWNTSTNKMFVWSGSAWSEISSSADIIAYKYTVANGATSVSGADDNGLTLSYLVGKEQVYINGVLQVRGSDYTASTGSSITGISAMATSDVVVVLAFSAFNVANTININTLNAKGDVLTATASSTPARLAVGSNDQVLVADSATASGLAWKSYGNQSAAGKNGILNSAFDFWSRGTSITVQTGGSYVADRWYVYRNDTGCTVSRQLTNDTTNLPFIQYCQRVQRNAGNTSTVLIAGNQSLESINSTFYAGKTVTLSFYARKGADYSASSNISFNVVSGTGIDQNVTLNYTGVLTVASVTPTLTTTWTRYTATGTVPANATEISFAWGNWAPTGTAGANDWFEITGVQLEVGSTATPYTRAGGSLQGELANSGGIDTTGGLYNTAGVSNMAGYFVAGKNKIINGDFSVWQRGTSFSSPQGGTYTADRFSYAFAGSATYTISRQAVTPGDIPGYNNAQFCLQHACTAVTTASITDQYHRIEDVRTLAGQTVTASFWARSTVGSPVVEMVFSQYWGDGGSGYSDTLGRTFNLTSTWTRYSVTVTLPSASGKTIGPNSHLNPILRFYHSVATFQIWGMQLEAGSVATVFTPAGGGHQQAELALCQRYYWRQTGPNIYSTYGFGSGLNSTTAYFFVQNPVPMRIAPTALEYASLGIHDKNVSIVSVTALTIANNSNIGTEINATSSGLTQYRPYMLCNNNNATGYIGLSAEL